MLKILLILTVLKTFTIVAGNNSNESPTTDQPAINSTIKKTTTVVAQAAEQQPSTHSEPMNFAKNDLLYLSELPLEQLLKVKKSIDEIQQVNRQEQLSSSFLVNHDNSNQLINDIGVVVEENEPRPSASTTIESRAIDAGSKSFFNFNGGKLLQSLIGGNSEPQQQQQKQQQPLAINRKTGWGGSGGGGSGLEGPWEQKQSKIQTIFQLSITALAFLAFAGYLLCMIVQAIKAKGIFHFPLAKFILD